MSWFGKWDGFDEEMQNATDVFARKPQTNYDRIISKTPEELAEWIAGDVLNLRYAALEMATGAWADWLRKEAT